MTIRKSPASSLKPFLLDTIFWQQFAADFWEKKPLFLKNVKSNLAQISDAEIFDLLVLYSDRCRRLKDPEGFKFYIDGFKADAEDVLQVLPTKKDNSLSGYHARMQAEFSDYCLVCDELLKVNLKKQPLLTDFTAQLYQHVGIPNRFSEIGLYLGNYRKTPFGVHVDSCGVFSFPVVGTKKFRLWPEGYGQKHPGLNRAFQYNKYKKDSVVLEASAGDMVYWPSSAWHIAESDGSFNATWSLGVWVDQPFKDTLTDALKGLVDKKLGAFGHSTTTAFKSLHDESGKITELPLAYAKSIEVLKEISALELQETFLKSWMTHLSMQGFKNLPKVNCQLTTKSKIKLCNKQSPILWQPGLTDKKCCFFSFGGILTESKKSGVLLKLIKDLNRGKTCHVGAFLKGPRQKEDFKSLQLLAEAGAFTSC